MSSTPDYGSGGSEKEDVAKGGDDAGHSRGEALEHQKRIDAVPAVPEPMVPDRVKRALKHAEDFATFKENRHFRFLHIFSGPRDKLAEALKREAEKAGMKLTAVSLDKKIDIKER